MRLLLGGFWCGSVAGLTQSHSHFSLNAREKTIIMYQDLNLVNTNIKVCCFGVCYIFLCLLFAFSLFHFVSMKLLKHVLIIIMFISYLPQFKHPVDHFLFSITTSHKKNHQKWDMHHPVLLSSIAFILWVLRHTSVFNHIKQTPARADVSATIIKTVV